MVKTLIARIKQLEQYREQEQTLLWEDATRTRWDDTYNNLDENDNAIFLSGNDLYICTINQINTNKSILFSVVKKIACSNDQFLRIHEIFPEQISRVKAHYSPFIHPQEIIINDVIHAAENQIFVSYYLLSNQKSYDNKSSQNTFKNNDRIVIIDGDGKLGNVKLYSLAGLSDFPDTSVVSVNVVGLTLEEIFTINSQIKRTSKKSNNVSRIENIIEAITDTERGIYNFVTFFSYHDALYNKRVYSNNNSESIKIIQLQDDENIYKISMGINEINDKSFAYFNGQTLIAVHKNTKAKGRSKITQGEIFSKEMKIGDYFYLCRSNQNLEVIGKIIGQAKECKYDDLGSNGWLQRPYKIIAEAVNSAPYNGDEKWWAPNANSTCMQVPRDKIEIANTSLFKPFFNAEFVNPSLHKLVPVPSNKSKIMNQPLNQILFGPPGTGKTFNTIDIALEIIGENISSKSRSDRKKIFDTKIEEGQIVFTTFHQSMSYEDFIEGIKPVTNNGQVSYEIMAGIFKKICSDAQTPNHFDFKSAYDGLKAELIDKEMIELKTPNDRTFSISLNSNDNLTLHTGKDKNAQGSLTQENIQKVRSGEKKFGKYDGYFMGVKTYLENEFHYSSEQNGEQKNFVLIIDEINRGNISQIFGELITLIEDDKRIGEKESIKITLPYSKDKFGVPSNLYIIGTMNTADKSVEALDAALRRRFSFVEMPPQPELIRELHPNNGVINNVQITINLINLLDTVNVRLEKLLDKNHKIGHSYFLSLQTLDELRQCFQLKIIPLLQEYFFGDFAKIGLVIGEGFVEAVDLNNNIFACFTDEDSNEYLEKRIYKIRDISQMEPAKFAAAINLLMNIQNQ